LGLSGQKNTEWARRKAGWKYGRKNVQLRRMHKALERTRLSVGVVHADPAGDVGHQLCRGGRLLHHLCLGWKAAMEAGHA